MVCLKQKANEANEIPLCLKRDANATKATQGNEHGSAQEVNKKFRPHRLRARLILVNSSSSSSPFCIPGFAVI